MTTTATTTRTVTITAVAWTRGPLERPADCFTELTQYATEAPALELARHLTEAGREPAVGTFERTLTIGDTVRVQAFGRMRDAVVVSFGRTNVNLEVTKNAAGEKITRPYAPTAIYLEDEADTVAAIRAHHAQAAQEADLALETARDDAELPGRTIAVIVDDEPAASFTGADLDDVVDEALRFARPLRAAHRVRLLTATTAAEEAAARYAEHAATAPTAELRERLEELETASDAETTDDQLVEALAIEAELDRRDLDEATDDPRAREGLGLSPRGQLDARDAHYDTIRDTVPTDLGR